MDINATLGTKDVVAARRLQSGSALITLAGREEKTKWENQTGILKAFGEGAKFQAREYTVLAFGVQTALDLDNQSRATASVHEQNPLFEEVKITSIGMLKRAKQEQREFTELFIRIADPGQANAVVKQGLLLDNRWHKCEVYDKDCRVEQCFNC